MLYSVIQLFFDSESDSVVIGLEDSPVISGDVKVRFESHSVSITAWRPSLEYQERLQCKQQLGCVGQNLFFSCGSCCVGCPRCSSCHAICVQWVMQQMLLHQPVQAGEASDRGGIWLVVQYNQDILIEYLLLLTWISYFIVLNLSDLLLE